MLPDESAFFWVGASAVEQHLNRMADNRFQISGQRYLEYVILQATGSTNVMNAMNIGSTGGTNIK
jgi:hypothetical protein